MGTNESVYTFEKESIAVFLDLLGKIRNTRLPLSKPLLPLFDAVVNAINAIEETNRDDGKVEIHIIRDDARLSLPECGPGSIISFMIFDNGIGFTKKHFEAFQTSDTTFKIQRGGKGVGRFLWLKAFEKVRIDSTYCEKDSYFDRNFIFELSNEGITDHLDKQVFKSDTGTRVELLYLKEDYRRSCPQTTEVIGRKLIQHCTPYFLWPKCPNIILIDGDEKILLNDLFGEQISSTATHRSFSIKGKDFDALHLRLYSSDDPHHKAHYCANNREVREENLNKIIPDLQGRLKDEEGRHFFCATYVSGEFLDETVNNERTDFELTDDGLSLFPGEITEKDLRNATLEEVKDFLQPYLRTISKSKMERIESFIYTQAPRYRTILKYGRDLLKDIPANISDQALELELHRIKSQMDSDIKKKGEEFLKGKTEESEDIEEFKERFREFTDQLNDFVKSELAEYIVHRKIVLDLLQKYLELGDEGKYHLEQTIHQLLFPMRTTSDDIDYENQNLWVIDEKLCYHRYLASDLPLSFVRPMEVISNERPDLIIFNSPFAFTEGEWPFSSIVIVEFKKPLRNDYTDEKNPIAQVYGYIKKIREGKVKDRRGRPIDLAQNTPFYCYVLCDLTEKIKEQAGNADLRPTPDGLGYFGYNSTYGCYIEVISYNKVISDAKKRNQILFDKLCLPHKMVSVEEQAVV